ncbi:MAG TPA: allantoicase [Acidimicrobiia bacterium]|nr:allantoicase [Acidimicrobiia bacterium]
MIDLASERSGGRIEQCNDEFFAEAANLIANSDPVWREGEYTDRGKWMDGWETRRRREPGHDWCIVELGIPGIVRRVTVDTSHFTGNYPEQFSLEGAAANSDWVELIPRTDLSGDSVASFEVSDRHRFEKVRLNIYPDGGVARLRVSGDPVPSMDLVCAEGPADLASSVLGGEVIDASDVHYSHPSNCLLPTEPAGMWDGWETKRRRDSGHDWVVVRLGLAGTVESLTVDTTHFKGNAPGWVSLDVSPDGLTWESVLRRIPVAADRRNEIELPAPVSASQIRLSIHPDGGVARLRVLGRPDRAAAGAARARYLNAVLDETARGFFASTCSSKTWIDAMVAARPFASVDAVLEIARLQFAGLAEPDWMEAFAGHPRIGERGDSTENREQSGTATASRNVLNELVEVNRAYEAKFDFTYIVYATGKSAPEMLDDAKRRLGNDRATEIANASAEQRKITETRLRRMLCQEPQ